MLKRIYSHLRGTAIVIQEGKVLLVRDKGKLSFSLPGGGIMKGEPTARTVARELYEELRLKAMNIQRLRECDYKEPQNKYEVYIVTDIAGKPNLQENELDEFVWWNMEEPLPIYGHVKHILTSLPSYYRHLVPKIDRLSMDNLICQLS